ncbi:hypothetical protein GS597_09880 [Synechococcales cyanobacterium C]|uniref:Uncharacterized protein n=1 Tax=Petrachloros mirabilis ULC683 TaxID=2781853 RepID=A0A8K1ZZR7_9CYAN|nr:hypothetical protein [Petrachloros mirabilis]NCJ06812.1 hypothetical protein [Petrachloros mirabilis ULC683]
MILPEPFASFDFSGSAKDEGAANPTHLSQLELEGLEPHPLLELPEVTPLQALDTADAATLRQELAALHQVIQQQQEMMQVLSARLNHRDGQLEKVELELQSLHQQCRQQVDQFQEMNAICQDLRSQLRRQQQRTSQYMHALTQQTDQPLDGVVHAPLSSQTYMAFAYEAISVASGPLAKTPPVSAWSATEVTESLTLYQKLAAITAAHLSMGCEASSHHQSHPRLKQSLSSEHLFEPSFTLSSATEVPTKVELPSFTRKSQPNQAR